MTPGKFLMTLFAGVCVGAVGTMLVVAPKPAGNPEDHVAVHKVDGDLRAVRVGSVNPWGPHVYRLDTPDGPLYITDGGSSGVAATFAPPRPEEKPK